ncbi:tRNA (adenosine(37)-N6)-dimethylallyltransferase MiaA [Candidatus Vallotia cooleyia]|uniref:tRNA (adenosine(37)-N6)-dimethylallyltransferase MiaA n=1 Tax=Candidatus Vallotiella adelgis TaxID=1177211 RepID=UPI001D02853F|nr:tRNA (adenosine(37)-N6)-dimethylallyltransferase MiaA [Candidatus Vallotia cooleyia]UDG82152.1 tRNA dimethylallyltransferase [Candidatus Vallotia cooleyia]
MASVPIIACLFGPTASGKSAAALELARDTPIEIVSIDSALIYRQMDIGTAKPTAADRAAVPHHLIDILDPIQIYSADQFRTDTLRLCAQIMGRGKLPLLVGGTMLYYKMLVEYIHELPGADVSIRSALDQDAALKGWPALHAKLGKIDPISAARIAPNDSRRIQRALEVWKLTGQPLSVLLQRRTADRIVASQQKAISPRCAVVSLEPSDRLVLHARIAQRFDAMLDANLIDEVQKLRARGDLHPGLPSMRCIGYRQAWAYLDGEYAYTTMREQSIFATRQLCKRQLTWLRAIPERIVVDCISAQAGSYVIDAVRKIWAKI